MPNSGHVVADRDGRAHDHAAAGRDNPQAGLGHAALLRRGARHPQREGRGNPGRGRRVRSLRSVDITIPDKLEVHEFAADTAGQACMKRSRDLTVMCLLRECECGCLTAAMHGCRYLVIKQAWPSCMRTLSGDHERFVTTYFKVYPGYYFTGDGCRRDADGYYWLIGERPNHSRHFGRPFISLAKVSGFSANSMSYLAAHL